MATENPFVFGKAAEGSYFTDRQEDARRLTANLTHGINTILISPRRWGKTSLVKKVISEIDHPEIKTVFLDIFQCKSEWEFYHACRTYRQSSPLAQTQSTTSPSHLTGTKRMTPSWTSCNYPKRLHKSEVSNCLSASMSSSRWPNLEMLSHSRKG